MARAEGRAARLNMRSEMTRMPGFINRLTADHWSGVLQQSSEIDYPAWDDVATAVTSMDAVTRTIVCLVATDGSTLTIGGGAGRHVIFMVSASGALWTLQSPERSASEMELLNAGGQEGDYPANQVVDTATAMRAASSFYRNGASASGLTWVAQG